MPIIYVKVSARRRAYVLNEYSALGDTFPESPGSIIRLRGRPRFSGTYRYTQFSLLRNGVEIPIPKRATIVLSSEAPVNGSAGRFYYDEPLQDDELGIDLPPSLRAVVRLGPEAFGNLCRLLTAGSASAVIAEVGFDAPEDDASGFDGMWDLGKSAHAPGEDNDDDENDDGEAIDESEIASVSATRGLPLTSFSIEVISDNLPKKTSDERRGSESVGNRSVEAIHQHFESLTSTSRLLASALDGLVSTTRYILATAAVIALASIWTCAST